MQALPDETDSATPPALQAFGGWEEAGWFGSSVIADEAVVAFHLPKLPGARKQGFHVVYRTQREPVVRKQKGDSKTGSKAGTEVEPGKPPRRVAAKFAALLDSAGAMRMVASSRDRFLFDTGAVLFFAEFPPAKLKQRAGNKLRRDLVVLGVRACVVNLRRDAVILMLWFASETGITDFVDAALPDHRIHPEFDAGPPPPAGGRARPASGASGKRGADQEVRLLKQIAALQGQVDALSRARSAKGALEQLGLDDARLKSMLTLLHPDKHGNSEAANEAAKWLNGMRDLLKDRGG